MNNNDQAVMILLGVVLLSKSSPVAAANRAVKAVERGGARIYDALHNDANHEQDLPGKGMTRTQVLAIAKYAGFADPKLAAAIAFAESGGVPGAFLRSSREYSVGLWQINTMVHPYSVAMMKDPLSNAAAAYKISKGGTDWRPWSAFTNGSYQKFRTGILAP